MAKKNKFTKTQTNKFGETFQDPAFRNDECSSFVDDELADTLHEHISTFLPSKWKANKIHERVRFSKYTKNSCCQGHVDDSIESNGYVSKWSIIIYLNDSDGATRLYNPKSMKHIDIVPEVGSMLIFEHNIPHTGMPPSKTKYIMRMDLMKKIKTISKEKKRKVKGKQICNKQSL